MVGDFRTGTGRPKIRKSIRDVSQGAALVELAIALPILVMLIVGMASAGAAYNNQLSLTHAAREAGRFGATLPVTNFASTQDWLDAVATSAVDNATGTLNSGTPGLRICVAYVHPNGALALDQTQSRTDVAGSVSYSGAPCFADSRPNDERRVQVRVERTVVFGAVFFSTDLTLDSQGVSRFEAAGGF